MEMEVKTSPFLVKGIEEDQGIVEHLISVYGVVDYKGDVAHEGMFTKTLQERGKKVKVVAAHNHKDVMSVVGVPLEYKEVSRLELPPEVQAEYPEATGGLMAKTQFLMDTPEGKGVFQRIKAGALDEFSFGYNALDYDYEMVETKGTKRKVRNLRTVRLWEYGPSVIGANPAAVSISSKDLELEEKKVDEMENAIRVRVRSSSDCEEGSFKTVNIDKAGVQAVMCKIDGDMTVQSYLFDKEKFDSDAAKSWADEHKSASLSMVISEVNAAVWNSTELTDVYIHEVYEDYVVVKPYNSLTFLKIPYSIEAGKVTLSPQEEWETGSMEFVSSSSEEVEEAFFDPLKIEKERWEISSILGRAG